MHVYHIQVPSCQHGHHTTKPTDTATNLPDGLQSMHVVSSWCPVYVRWRWNGENSRRSPGAFQTCTWLPCVTAR